MPFQKRGKMMHCIICETLIYRREKRQRGKIYCSLNCSWKGKKRGKMVNCYICKKEMYKRLSQIEERNFCSKQCTFKGKRGKQKRGTYKKCTCGENVYYFPRDHGKNKKFCSRRCANKNLLKGEDLICKTCKIKYHCSPSMIRLRGSSFCSKKCMNKGTRGKKNRQWKKGKALKKNLWNVFSQYIRQRDRGICISCGKQDFWRKMDAGHYIPKTAGLALYFDEQNVNCQCTYCNRWMHGNLSRYAIALRKKHGENILEELDKKRRIITKISMIEYQKLIDIYKDKLLEINR